MAGGRGHCHFARESTLPDVAELFLGHTKAHCRKINEIDYLGKYIALEPIKHCICASETIFIVNKSPYTNE